MAEAFSTNSRVVYSSHSFVIPCCSILPIVELSEFFQFFFFVISHFICSPPKFYLMVLELTSLSFSFDESFYLLAPRIELVISWHWSWLQYQWWKFSCMYLLKFLWFAAENLLSSLQEVIWLFWRKYDFDIQEYKYEQGKSSLEVIERGFHISCKISTL